MFLPIFPFKTSVKNLGTEDDSHSKKVMSSNELLKKSSEMPHRAGRDL